MDLCGCAPPVGNLIYRLSSCPVAFDVVPYFTPSNHNILELTVAVRLIENGVERTSSPQVWADLGAGKGLFTYALADLLPPLSTIFAVDRDASALSEIESDPKTNIRTLKKDFVRGDLGLEPLDGVLMANALHFVKDKAYFIRHLKKHFRSPGRMIIVEYDRETATPWVPYPVSFEALQQLGAEVGFSSVIKLEEEPSIFNRVNIYSALLR